MRNHKDVSPECQDPDAVGAWFTTAVPSPQELLRLASPRYVIANKALHVHACPSHEWRLLGTW